jgi:hypothetical protein
LTADLFPALKREKVVIKIFGEEFLLSVPIGLTVDRKPSLSFLKNKSITSFMLGILLGVRKLRIIKGASHSC